MANNFLHYGKSSLNSLFATINFTAKILSIASSLLQMIWNEIPENGSRNYIHETERRYNSTDSVLLLRLFIETFKYLKLTRQFR